VAWIQRGLGAILGALLFPFERLPPLAGLTVLSLLTAVAALVLFRATTDRRALLQVKRQIHAAIFEIRLFNDDLRTMLAAVGDIIRHNARYLRLALVPTLLMIVPFVALIAQLQAYYGYRGLDVGATTVVKVRLGEEAFIATSTPALALEAPGGLRVETPAVWIRSEREAAWRVRAERAGTYDLRLTVNGVSVVKRVRVFDAIGWRAPQRLQGGFVNELLYPAEAPLDSDVAIDEVTVAYPERELSILGWEVRPVTAFVVLLIVFALLLKKRLGVVM
jgi:hypothetical protein